MLVAIATTESVKASDKGSITGFAVIYDLEYPFVFLIKSSR